MVLDAVIVGAGFSGLQTLQNLRRAGFKVRVLEAGASLGGVWYWNRFPGLRTDTGNPIYQLLGENTYDFPWKERFSSYDELREYFQYVDKKLDLSKDIQYNTRVVGAEFNNEYKRWLVKTDGGAFIWAKHLILCTGFASKRYTPNIKGLEKFKGEWHHSALWPSLGVDVAGKRVAVIGTGASGVQIVQAIAPSVSHLTVYQRTPNFALPMQQVLRGEEGKSWKFPTPAECPKLFEGAKTTFSGMVKGFVARNAFDDTEEERRAFYQSLFDYGGFAFWIETYQDLFFNMAANETAYNFWRDKVRARITDPRKKEILAPMKMPHPFGAKRPSLETCYYERYNQPNVDIINVKESKILEITDKGIRTEKEGVVEFDIIIFATGFDGVTGGILDIDIRNGSGASLKDKWSTGVSTFMGISSADFPNMYFLYGPQSPSSFANGPSCGGVQAEWIAKLMSYMREKGKDTITARPESEDKWTTHVHDAWKASLFPLADSWWQGANIPGKIIEPLAYANGMPAYVEALEKSAGADYEGFVLA